MSRNVLCIITTIVLLLLVTGIVSANNDTPLGKDNESIVVQQSLQPTDVSRGSASQQPDLERIKRTLPPQLQQAVDEQVGYNNSINQAITEKERQLQSTPLKIHDNRVISPEVNGFSVSRSRTTSPDVISANNRAARKHVSSNLSELPANQIPFDGIIKYDSDGKTRVFSADGTQLAYAVDNDAEKVQVPSGKILAATHIISIPDKATISKRGDKTFITDNGEIILTIIDEASKDESANTFAPVKKGPTWVAYAESDPYYYLGQFHSTWRIPNSAPLVMSAVQLADRSNILFNGIEPADGSTIFQPVTAYSFYPHSSASTNEQQMLDPAIINKWTGSSWHCPQDNTYCTHSPVLSFSEGDVAQGDIYWVPYVLQWNVVLQNVNQGTSTSYWSDDCAPIDVNPYLQPYRAVTVYEYQPFSLNGGPIDEEKVGSTTFYGISASDTNGLPINLNWHGNTTDLDHPNIHGLFVDLSQLPSTIKLSTGHNLPPVARFTADNCYEGECPTQQSLKFTSTSYNDPTSWSWNFGDGATGTGKEVSHTYQQSGMYVVTLTVSNNFGSNSKNTGYTMTGSTPTPTPTTTPTPTPSYPPVASYTISGLSGLNYQFTDTSTNSPTSFVWYFGDGGVSTAQNPTHVYPAAGTYTVEHRVTNSYGSGLFSQTEVITGSNPTPTPTPTPSQAPVADFTASSYDGVTPFTVHFTDTSTGGPTEWHWDFGDPSEPYYRFSTEQNPTYTYKTQMTPTQPYFTVNLIVRNSYSGLDSVKTKQIKVMPPYPLAQFTASPTSGTAPLQVQFTDSNYGAPGVVSWDFGDGASSYEQNPVHTYTSGGDYTAKQTVTNSYDSHWMIATIHVAQDVTPTASFTSDISSGTPPLTVQFTDTSTNSPTAWSWNFGDGTTSTLQSPSHTYTALGTYTVSLTLTNAQGVPSTATMTNYVTVTDTPAASGATWTQATANANWAGRQYFGSTVFNGKMWVLGGWTTQNDVWSSVDGAIWTQATPAAQWSGRNRFSAVTYNNKMWVMGGNANGPSLNDVWSSADGTTWIQTTAGAAWPVRFEHASVVFNNKMWVLGGTETYGTNMNDVWSSADGTTWTRATANAPWGARRGHAAVTFNGKMWIMGGLNSAYAYVNDVWSSSDGITWTRATANAAWSPRSYFQAVVYDNKMWVLGGPGANDVWYSSDGVTWTQATAGAGWSARSGHQALAYNNTLWVLGGNNLNDVWYAEVAPVAQPVAGFTATITSGTAPLAVQFTDTSTNTPIAWNWSFGDGTTSVVRSPSHTYGNPGIYSVTLTATNNVGSNTTTKTNYITVLQPSPVASFIAIPTSGMTPLAVNFTDTSTGGPTSWNWSFGDGTTSTAQNPSHMYSATGIYTVSLTATNSVGSNTLTNTNFITVLQSKPAANFTASPTSGPTPLMVQFTDTSTNTPMSWNWSFGDGTISTVQNPSHQYSTAGIYTVSLNTTNAGGSTVMTKPNYIVATTPAIPNGATWTRATANANWAGRQYFGSTVFNGKMWVLGGWTTQNDIWSSVDGAIWTQATPAAQWSGRNRFSAVTYNNKMWVMGGNANGPSLNDVWSSADGTTWIQTTAGAAWPVRFEHASVVFNNKMWVLGGTETYGTNMNDVWSSADGTTWTRATANAPWGARRGHAAVTFNGKMWIMGGLNSAYAYVNDVWSSSDGITWTRATANAAWSPRSYFQAVVYDNKMWVLGGPGANDVWYSSDGVTWTQATAGAGWSARSGHQAIAYNNTLWVLGGNNLNDVWYAGSPPVIAPVAGFTATPTSGTTPLVVQFTDTSTNTPIAWNWDFGDGTTSIVQNPSHQYTAGGTYTVSLSAINTGGSNTVIKTNYITVIQPRPIANFTATPTSGTTPLVVQFTDTSTNTPVSWNWSFGDGTTSNLQNPGHQYSAAGTYTISLTATNAGGSDTVTKANYITADTPAVEISLEDPVTGPVGNWDLGSGPNSQNYGNLVITSNTNWALTTSATNGDYLMQGQTKLANKLKLNGGDITTFTDSGSGSKTEVLSFSQQVDPADPAGDYSTTVTFTWVIV